MGASFLRSFVRFASISGKKEEEGEGLPFFLIHQGEVGGWVEGAAAAVLGRCEFE